jgi:hypothetical protein
MNVFLPPRPAWRHLGNPEMGFMDTLSESIRATEFRHPGLLPDIRRGSTLFIASDYGGQHNQSRYTSLVYLLADLGFCGDWEDVRKSVRRQFLTDNRRMSYKNLNDRRRQKALLPFLYAAN